MISGYVRPLIAPGSRSGYLRRNCKIHGRLQRRASESCACHAQVALSENDVTFLMIAISYFSKVCVEAGMLALRRDSDSISHEDFMEGIRQVQMKKKASLQYYA